ncbi:hypothetical protein J7T55_013950 [Diaporthe amygdali]|uniref:uncharacterized protein n=1 Tax=Phomopsis amygdali TaxID=1214568 RepID=UPI0022FED87C|nr:uncharacterized protein J7T55_013950 [Diaporthe amygdali]KAJ0119746.1 hypothetical protein J7T55_013950 [Diaporthe amygdali]
MDQNASSEVEELEASYRLLDEKRRRLEAQKEQALQQAHRSYEVDRTADHEDIKEKELALQEFKEKYYSELRTKEEALQMAYQREATRKRKHEAEIEQFNQELSRLQRRKPNDLGFQGRPETPRTSISPSTLAQDLGQHSPIEFGPRTVGAHASPRAQNLPNSDNFDSPAKPRPEQTSQGRKECSGLLGKMGDTVVESSMERDHTTIVRIDTEEGLKSNLPQPDVYLDENDLSAWSEFADPSGDDINSEDEEIMNRDEASRQSRSLPLTERTIPYEEVYRAAQDPQAEYKHWIVEHPKGCGTWYIVRCVKHGLNWHNNPLPAAGKHILGPMHKCSSGKASLAIKELGERVIGCDQPKARASNAEYKNSLDLGYKPRKHMKQDRLQIRQKSAQKTMKHRPGNELSNEFDITDPVVGEVYQAWWDGEDTGWYLVVILPYSGDSDWKEVGMTGSLFTSGLAKEIPNCFKVVKTATNSGQEISRLTWAQGFQDGGPRVRSRKFPCLFLHPPLEIPTADQRFEIDAKAKVLAFRTAHQLRHQSTIHSISLDTRGIEAYQGLAREFKARLKEIRAKHDSAPGRGVDDGSSMGTPSMKDRQRPNDTASVENMEDTGLSTDSNILQDPHQHANRPDLSMPRDGSGDSTVLARFIPKSPRPEWRGRWSISGGGLDIQHFEQTSTVNNIAAEGFAMCLAGYIEYEPNNRTPEPASQSVIAISTISSRRGQPCPGRGRFVK